MATHENYNHQKASEKLKELIDEVSICMMATTDTEGRISSRPMTTISAEDGTLWFFTNEHSGKVDDQDDDSTIYLMYADPSKQTYIHVRGTSSLVTDRETIKSYWKPILKTWFPEGTDDPKLCLLKINVEEARYWDSSSNKMIMFFEMAKALLTKEPYREGETGTLKDFSHK